MNMKLAYNNEVEQRAAAVVVAQLVREGVTFTATELQTVGGNSLYIEFTGGH